MGGEEGGAERKPAAAHRKKNESLAAEPMAVNELQRWAGPQGRLSSLMFHVCTTAAKSGGQDKDRESCRRYQFETVSQLIVFFCFFSQFAIY